MALRAHGHRGRALAIWFVGMLVLSAIPAFVPTAAAIDEPSITFTLQVRKQGVGDWANAVSGMRLEPQDVIRFTAEGHIGPCTGAAGGAQRDIRATLTVDTSNLGAFTTRTHTATFAHVEGGQSYSGTTNEMTIDSRVDGLEANAKKFTGTLLVECGTDAPQVGFTPSSENVTKNLETTTPIPVDNKKPVLQAPAVRIVQPSSAVNPGTAATVGARILFWANGTTDGNPFTLTVDATQLGHGTATSMISNGTMNEIIVNKTGGGARDGDASIFIEARDSFGNVQTHELKRNVDNDPPAAALVPTPFMRREIGGAEVVSVGWTPTTEVDRAQIDRNGAVAFTNTTPPYNVGGSVASPPSLVLFPVDNAGNVNRDLPAAVNWPPRVVSTNLDSSLASPLRFSANTGANPVGNLEVTTNETLQSASHLKVYLERVGSLGQFWNGGNPADAASWTSTPTAFSPATAPTTPTAVITAFAGQAWPSNTYRLNVTVEIPGRGLFSHLTYFQVETNPPNLIEAPAFVTDASSQPKAVAAIGDSIVLPWASGDPSKVAVDSVSVGGATSFSGKNLVSNRTSDKGLWTATATVVNVTEALAGSGAAHQGTLVITAILRDVDTQNTRTATWSVQLDNVRPAGAIAGAKVGLEVVAKAAGTDTSVKVKPTWTPDPDIVQVRVRLNGGALSPPVAQDGEVTLSASEPLTVELFAVDPAGNQAATSAQVPAPRVTVTKFNHDATSPLLVPRMGVGDIKLAITHDAPAVLQNDVTIRLQRTSDNTWWNGDDPTTAGAWTTAPNHVFFKPKAGSISGDVTFENLTGKNFPHDRYIMYLLVNGTSGSSLNRSMHFRVDPHLPAIPAADAALPSRTLGVHGQDNNPVDVRINFSEVGLENTGIANVTLELVSPATWEVVKNVHGADARWDMQYSQVVMGTNTTFTPFPGRITNATSFDGWINATLPNLTVGDYLVRVVVTDNAGNSNGKLFSASGETYKVRPRVSMIENANLPFLHEDGIAAVALAAFESTTPLPGKSCDLTRLCWVHNVTIYGRTLNGQDVPLLTFTEPTKQTLHDHDGEASTPPLAFYNYTQPRIPTGLLDTSQQVDLFAEAWVRINGVDYRAVSTPIRVKNPQAPTLQVNLPLKDLDQPDWYINTTGTVKFNASIEYKAGGTPLVNYTLRRVSGNGAPCVAVDQFLPVEGASPKILFNYTTTWSLLNAVGGCPAATQAEYVVRVEARTPGGAALIDVKERAFAVSASAPTFTFPTQLDPRVAGNTNTTSSATPQYYVPRTFDLEVVVNHGVANLTANSDLEFELVRATATPDQALVIPRGSDGFNVVIKGTPAYQPGATSTTLLLEVTLPNEASGKRYALNVTAQTDARNTVGAAYNVYSGTGWAYLTLDRTPPSVGVNTLLTNQTGTNRHAELRFVGFAQDAESGVGKVEVKLKNLTSGMTYDWTVVPGGTWMEGDRDSWASSDLLKLPGQSQDRFRNVAGLWPLGDGTHKRLDNGVDNVVWILNSTTRPRYDAAGAPVSGAQPFPSLLLDRLSEYEIFVRATDAVGNPTTTLPSQRIRFDASAPNVTAALSGPADFSWGGSAVFTVGVEDNHCLKRVSLFGRAPSGAVVGPADFTRPAGAACGAANPDAAHVWTIDLKDHRLMANEIGEYTYWIVAEDHAGLKNATPSAGATRTALVRDTTPATVEFLHLEPPLAQTGGSARLFAQILENDRIDRVHVIMSRLEGTSPKHYINPNGSHAGSAQFALPAEARPVQGKVAANGTGTYVIDTRLDFNTTLEEGYYLLEVRPRDVNYTSTCGAGGCPQKNIILRVVGDAAPFLALEAPSESAVFLGAQPTIRFRVYDPAVARSGLTLEAGPSEQALQSVTANATLTEELTAGNSTGWTVVYRPTLTNATQNLTVRLRAADASGFANTTTHTWRVDADAPNATVNVTGTRQGPDNRSYVVAGTRIEINATDNLSGVASIAYAVNGGAEQPYTAAFQPDGDDGAYVLTWIVRDVAGNEGRGTVSLFIDTKGPVIRAAQHGDEVLVTVTDDGVGVDEANVTIHYAYGELTTFTAARMEKATGNSYRAVLPGNASETGLRYYFTALDRFGNLGTNYSASRPFEILPNDDVPVNLPPTVVITAPTDMAAVGTTVQLRWLAEDPEGTPLNVTISRRDPAGGGATVRQPGPNTGSHNVSMRGLSPGVYTLVVTVTDGVHSEQASVNVDLKPGNGTFTNVTAPTNVTAGSEASFTLRINPQGRTLQSAMYVILREDEEIATGPLTSLPGGLFTASYVPTEPGQYSVLVRVSYQDGTTEPEQEIAIFDVQGATPPEAGGSFPESLVTLLVLGLLTVALAAYAAFGRWRR